VNFPSERPFRCLIHFSYRLALFPPFFRDLATNCPSLDIFSRPCLLMELNHAGFNGLWVTFLFGFGKQKFQKDDAPPGTT
jgi:hypothetical protein